MELNYYRKNVYGNENLYIADKTQANMVQTLTGKKTVTYTDLNILEQLTGGIIREVIAPKETN